MYHTCIDIGIDLTSV